jgi:hypothetical protein
VARWNESRRYGRAYLDDDGGPTLASDLLLGAGVGSEAVTAWVELVLAMTPVFVAEVWPAAGLPAGPRNE